MRNRTSKTGAILAAPFAAALLVAPAALAEEPAPAPTKGEERLTKMLEGRVAGEPSDCIRTFPSGSMQVIDRTAIVYRQGRTLWVNRTRDPRALDSDDYLVIRKFGDASRLCRLDNVTTRDRVGNFFSGVIMLDQFVPYTLPKQENEPEEAKGTAG